MTAAKLHWRVPGWQGGTVCVALAKDWLLHAGAAMCSHCAPQALSHCPSWLHGSLPLLLQEELGLPTHHPVWTVSCYVSHPGVLSFPALLGKSTWIPKLWTLLEAQHMQVKNRRHLDVCKCAAWPFWSLGAPSTEQYPTILLNAQVPLQLKNSGF